MRRYRRETISDSLASDNLIQAAWQARRNAYAPYSHFAVGAVVLGESGQTYAGVNVENASYGLTVCAERVAIFTAIAAGETLIRAVAVVAGASVITPPCGACRQVISEFGRDVQIVAETLGGERRTWTIEELLPDSFGPRTLDTAGPATTPDR